MQLAVGFSVSYCFCFSDKLFESSWRPTGRSCSARSQFHNFLTWKMKSLLIPSVIIQLFPVIAELKLQHHCQLSFFTSLFLSGSPGFIWYSSQPTFFLIPAGGLSSAHACSQDSSCAIWSFKLGNIEVIIGCSSLNDVTYHFFYEDRKKWSSLCAFDEPISGSRWVFLEFTKISRLKFLYN